MNVTVLRLFQDFSADKFKINMVEFGDLIKFLEIGLTKIQNKLIFSSIDSEKKGYITVNELQNALEDAGETL
jgi:Ca2+-binding EF-hand superfamily protein